MLTNQNLKASIRSSQHRQPRRQNQPVSERRPIQQQRRRVLLEIIAQIRKRAHSQLPLREPRPLRENRRKSKGQRGRNLLRESDPPPRQRGGGEMDRERLLQPQRTQSESFEAKGSRRGQTRSGRRRRKE